MRVEQGFQPTPYTEGNPFTTDPVLPNLLKRLLPRDVHEEVYGDLERFGLEVLTTLHDLTSKTSEPRVVQYDQWGRRIDDLQTSEGWRGLKAQMQEEGVIGIPFERKYGEFSRVYGFMKQFIAIGDSDVISCPFAMTDGTSRVLELVGSPAVKRDIFPRLTSRDPSLAFTAGQWMTERPGGSDVSQTETIARPVSNASSPYGPVYRIDGFKWFSSATDSDIAVALARTGPPESGSRGLSLFLIPLRRPLIRPVDAPRPPALTNNIKIHRLKNKFGTKILPTAELSLEGAEAYLLGEVNQGVKFITPVLNITRIHSALTSVGSIRKCLAIATAYSSVRAISGGRQLLKDNVLHVAELARAHLTYRALTHLVFGVVLLLGKTEYKVATDDEVLRLRLLTPAVKAFAADKASGVMEECMTMLGGQGYMEESRIGTVLKDAMVEKIWEGTTTVLSLDMVRAAAKPGVLHASASWANTIVSSCPADLVHRLAERLATLRICVTEVISAYTNPSTPLLSRPTLALFAYTTSALYLLEHAIWAHESGEATANTDIEVFQRWIDEGGLLPALQDVRRVKTAGADRTKMDAEIVYGNLSTTQVADDLPISARL